MIIHKYVSSKERRAFIFRVVPEDFAGTAWLLTNRQGLTDLKTGSFQLQHFCRKVEMTPLSLPMIGDDSLLRCGFLQPGSNLPTFRRKSSDLILRTERFPPNLAKFMQDYTTSMLCYGSGDYLQSSHCGARIRSHSNPNGICGWSSGRGTSIFSPQVLLLFLVSSWLLFIHLARQRCQMTQRHFTEDSILHSHLYEKVKLLR